MKKAAGITMILFLGISLFAQDAERSKKEQRKLNKQLKKEQQAEMNAQRARMTEVLISHQRFVLEADQLRDKRGGTANVSSMINFIACDSTRGVIQVGSASYVGLNGVGGVTVEGDVINYEYARNEKNSSFTITYNLRTATGPYDVNISVNALGRADATVSSMWPGRLIYIGNLVSPAASRVYKGSTSY